MFQIWKSDAVVSEIHEALSKGIPVIVGSLSRLTESWSVIGRVRTRDRDNGAFSCLLSSTLRGYCTLLQVILSALSMLRVHWHATHSFKGSRRRKNETRGRNKAMRPENSDDLDSGVAAEHRPSGASPPRGGTPNSTAFSPHVTSTGGNAVISTAVSTSADPSNSSLSTSARKLSYFRSTGSSETGVNCMTEGDDCSTTPSVSLKCLVFNKLLQPLLCPSSREPSLSVNFAAGAF